MKKFYKLVAFAAEGDGFAIHLDGRPVKTPSGAILYAPVEALADEIVKEWAAQGEKIDLETMPLTQILTTMQDHVPAGRDDMTAKVLAYLNTDLICYRTDEPEAVAQTQQRIWNPWIDWFENTYNARLETTTGLTALKQPPAAHEKVENAVKAMNDYEFTVVQMVTPLVGSLVLSLAFTAGDATPEQLFDAANVEENYKAEIYNEAKHGVALLQEKKQVAMKRDLVAARMFLDLCKN